MLFMNSYYKLGVNNFDKDLTDLILSKFQDTFLTTVSAVKTDDGNIFMRVYGAKIPGIFSSYYYDADGNESYETIQYKRLKHFSYNPETKTYQGASAPNPMPEQDINQPHKSFDIYESRFLKHQSLVGFDPEHGSHNIYQLCDGEIQFTKQHNLCGRTFLEFKVNNKQNFPGPVMVESNGKRLTYWEGAGFQVFPDLGVVLQSKNPDFGGTNMVEYNLFDVTMENNPCLLFDKVCVKVDKNTGNVSCGIKNSYAFGACGIIDAKKERFSIQELRASYLQRQQKKVKKSLSR